MNTQNVVALKPEGSVREYSSSQLKLIRDTVAAGTTPLEFDLFIEAAKRVGLDPFRKQIYAIVYNANKPDKRKMSIITGIDGFRAVAERSGNYRPDEEEPAITYCEDIKGPENPLGIEKATVTVHKLGPDNKWYPVKGVAYWDEFAPIQDKGDWVDKGETWRDSGKPKKSFVPNGEKELQPGNWVKMPRVMIGKCAEAQALRKGWPEALSGVYAQEEMDQLADATPSEVIEHEEAERRERMTNSKDSIAIAWMPGDALEHISTGQFMDRCLAFIQETERLDVVQDWRNRNLASLQAFWAKEPNDALELKAAIEKKLTQTGE